MAELGPAPPRPPTRGPQSAGCGRLLVAADAFLFLGFVLAYLYLRALDDNGMSNPPGQNPSGTMGLAVLVLVCVTAALVQVGAGRLASAGAAASAPRRGRARCRSRCDRAGRVAGVPARLLASHAGALGSVFVGFIAVYLVHLLGGLYWLDADGAAARRGASGHRAALRALLVVPGRGARDLLRPSLYLA